MSQKLFTLINGDKVHLAPGSKIIPAEEFSKALDSAALVQTVKEDAEAYKLSVAKEAEAIKEAAEAKGFQEGLKQWAENLKLLEDEIQRVHQEVSETIIPVALKAAKKIIGREIDTSKEVVVDIVLNNLKAVAHHKKIRIHVNQQDLRTLEANKDRLKKNFEHLESLQLIESDDVNPGGAIIETEGGIINAQLENLIRVLEKAFENFTKQEV